MFGSKKYDLFITMKKAQSKIKSNRIDLQKIRSENTIRRYKFSPENEVKKLQSQPGKFGTFSINDGAMKTERFVTDLDVKSSGDKQTCYITAASLISETLLAIADNKNKNVKLINTTMNKIMAETSLSSPPWDITTTSDDKLGITIPEEEKIQFLSFSMPNGDAVSLEKSITVAGKCHGVDFIRLKGKLIVSYCCPGKVEILNLDGAIDRRLDLALNHPIYISLIPNTNMVCISDISVGNWRYQNGSVKYVQFGEQQKELVEIIYVNNRRITPFGLATDKSGTTYACDYDNKVHVFSPYMNQTRNIDVNSQVLIDYIGENISPRSIAFCNKSFRLYIAMYGDKMKVYSVA